MSKLISFPVRGPSKGYVKNLAPSLIDDSLLVLTGGLNVYNRLGGVQMVPGWKKFYETALTGVPSLVGVLRKSDLSKMLVVLTHQKAYSWNAVTENFDDITNAAGGYTASSGQPWSACVFKDMLIFTNQSDPPQKWTGTGLATDLGGSPPKAKVVVPFMNHVVLANVVDESAPYPDKLVWSNQDNAEDWTGGVAGEARLLDTPGQILAIAPVTREVAVVYKDDSWYTLEYTALSTFPFRVRLVERTGILSQRAVATVGGLHFFIGRDNIYVNNGAQSQPIGDPIADELFSVLNQEAANMAFAFADTENRDVWFVIPATGSAYPNQAYVYNYEQKVWSPPIEFPATCVGVWSITETPTIDDMAEPIDSYILPIDSSLMAAGSRRVLFGASDGYIRQLDTGLATRDGAAYPAEAEFKLVSGGSNIYKRVQQIVVQAESLPTAGLDVYAGVTDRPDGIPAWYDAGSITPDSDPWAWTDVTGRYVAARFRSESANRLWRINGFDIRFLPQGER